MVLDLSWELPLGGAQAFWRDKAQINARQFKALSDEARLRAFAVSGIAKGDELASVYDAIRRAIETGTSFEQFREECAEVFERRGWVGKRAWRVQTIFQTNIQTAYNVGRYEQLVEEKEIFPYWMYDAINDSHTRPAHLALDGRVWPADHPVWQTWYPPNGFNCRCSVSGVTKGQVENRGLAVEEDDPTDRQLEIVDKATGNKLRTVPILPEPGFDFNPGEKYWQKMALHIDEKLKGYPPELAALVEKELAQVLKKKKP